VEQSRPNTVIKQSPSKATVEKSQNRTVPEEQEQEPPQELEPAEEDEAALARKLKKQNFYKEVDEEDFF
jgi:hypothetical protein